MLRVLLSGLLVFALAACIRAPFRPYSMEVQQGNYVTQEAIDQLKPGMTREQVRFVLGTPLIVDPFRQDRWEYVYTRKLANRSAVETRRLVVFFEGEQLARVAGDVVTRRN